MNVKLLMATTLFVAAPFAAFAQSEKPNAQPWKPTIEDTQKLVDTISGDKDKLKVYCELGKLHELLDKAEEKGDAKEFEALADKLDSLEQQMGAEYISVTDGLADIDPNSAEGQKFSAVFAPLRKQCRQAKN